jgi:hypothetical protein
MTLRPPHQTFVHTDADLLDLWRAMMGPGGFGTRSLWHVFLDDDGRMSPVVLPIDDLPAEPDPALLATLGTVLRDLVADQGLATVAVLLSRPGPDAVLPPDRRWACAIGDAYDGLPFTWPIHLATRGSVRVFAPDDLIAART